jgi:hypothetical protein
MLDGSALGFHAAEVKPGDRRGVFAVLGGKFFYAVQDAAVGIFDDPATVIAERVGWERGLTVLKELRSA